MSVTQLIPLQGATCDWPLHMPQLRASIAQPKIANSHRRKGTAINLHRIVEAAKHGVLLYYRNYLCVRNIDIKKFSMYMNNVVNKATK